MFYIGAQQTYLLKNDLKVVLYFMPPSEPTNIFKLGTKETSQCVPAIPRGITGFLFELPKIMPNVSHVSYVSLL